MTAALRPVSGGRYVFLIVGSGAELTGAANPALLGLTVGDDAGTDSAIALIL